MLDRISSDSLREATGRGWDACRRRPPVAPSRSQSGKTTISAPLEKLPDATARDTMREHLREALDRIVSVAS